ncbi:LLM class flavin-dependent oxidoreductase [Streptosporangium carneum]|uniref:FMNH2-dependent monooxygenase n=1 Tax=Streptosporangium carneum TaxID=47481 RepID=A0A9W6MGN3_9ACTN|nr:LLM class flavin-dependent oxidoreductase [Streptosporangium carneum]GLK13421.1 FMNH2-dependent monooxygenase [Streptosporangium carneum]
MTPEFHLTLPVERRRAAALPPLPDFVTDLRPSDAAGPYERLARVGRAAELAGLDGVLAPFDPAGQDPLVVAGGLLRGSRHTRVTAEFHPGIATPVYAAKLSASLQRFSGDRFDWRLTVDLDPQTARAQGDFLEGAERYARAEEFLTVAKGVWSQEDYDFQGSFYEVLGGGLLFPLSGRAFPRVQLSGLSAEALALSARHGDVHVFGLDDDLDSGIAALRELSLETGREPVYGLRLPVLAREDDIEARRDALRLWIRRGGAREAFPEPDPCTALWPGFGTVGLTGSHEDGPAAGFHEPGLVGSYGRVADAVRGHLDRGVSVFFLEVEPHLEETYRLGEHLLPLLAKEKHHAG